MSYIFNKEVDLDKQSTLLDSFGRIKISEPITLFDSKLLYDKQPLIWDEVINGGAMSSHILTDVCVNMNVKSNGDYVIRQTKERFNYQPGKSIEINMTGVLTINTALTNTICMIGAYSSSTVAPYDTNYNGLYFMWSGGQAYVCVSKPSGTVNIEQIPQSQWNINKMDGTDSHGIVVDWTKTQIFVIQYQWLGVVVFSLSIDGEIYPLHKFTHANKLDNVYSSNPNLPLRYEIRSTGGENTLKQISSSVITSASEINGVPRELSIPNTSESLTINTGAFRGLYLYRLKNTHLDSKVILDGYEVMTTSNVSAEVKIALNPRLSGFDTLVWSGITNSPLEVAICSGTTNNTLTGTTDLIFNATYLSANGRLNQQTKRSPINLGVKIDGTRDYVGVFIRPTGNGTFFFNTQLRELL